MHPPRCHPLLLLLGLAAALVLAAPAAHAVTWTWDAEAEDTGTAVLGEGAEPVHHTNVGTVVILNEGGGGDDAVTAPAASDVLSACNRYPINWEAPSLDPGADVPAGTSLDIVLRNRDGVVLRPAYPNPMRDVGTLRFGLPEASDVTVEVYDVLGRRVTLLAEGSRDAGWYEVALPASSLAPGVYVVRLVARALAQRVTVAG